MNVKFTVSLLYSLLVFVTVSSQEIPPISIFNPEDYGAGNQNWDISQDSDKNIYVANDLGLLRYNGNQWDFYSSPNETIIRSVATAKQKIYTGCYMDFGFWEMNANKQLEYTSLVTSLGIEPLEDEQFWDIVFVKDLVLFQSLNRIYIYNSTQNTYTIIHSDSTILKLFQTNEAIYFQKENMGLYTIQNGKELLVSKERILKDNAIVQLFSHGKGLLFLTSDSGFYLLEDKTISPYFQNLEPLLNNKTVYSAIQDSKGNFILGTISHGLLMITNDGVFRYQINNKKGLGNNTVLSISEDIDHNIWLALDTGINCINTSSSVEQYSPDYGEIGAVYCSALYQGNLYLGTNQGLFFRNQSTKNPFQLIKNTEGQVWDLVVLKGSLFCGHHSGTFQIRADTAIPISNITGTWSIKEIPGYDTLLLQGNYSGLYVLEKIKNTWGLKNKMEGFSMSSRFFEYYDKHIFVNHEYKGVYKLKPSEDFLTVQSIQKEPISKGLHSSLVQFNGDLLYSFKNGILKYQTETKQFIKDSIIEKALFTKDYSSGNLIETEGDNYLWYFSTKGISYLKKNSIMNVPEHGFIALPEKLRKSVVYYENITRLEKHLYLIGTTEGYLRLNLSPRDQVTQDIRIDKVWLRDKGNSKHYKNPKTKALFSTQENNIGISFVVPQYDKFNITEYQYRLEGFYDTWSSWTTDALVSFDNLPYGDYMFQVRARQNGKVGEHLEKYMFSIERPWYIGTAMLFLYAILFIAFSFMMHTIYKKYYRHQQSKALQEKEQELHLQQLESQQQLMQLENEKLQQDIDNKSRELAIATMSLIKKNEFLHTIKATLKSKDDLQVPKVLKIIDKNLNGTDDWQLFEKAFNNADKDFLKNIKSIHPNLTPNDLKLCAYLRLNLSSKEIAPLLNISPRSVEVKRYRLRKKMGLAHEISLTNYIIDL